MSEQFLNGTSAQFRLFSASNEIIFVLFLHVFNSPLFIFPRSIHQYGKFLFLQQLITRILITIGYRYSSEIVYVRVVTDITFFLLRAFL